MLDQTVVVSSISSPLPLHVAAQHDCCLGVVTIGESGQHVTAVIF